MPARNWATLSVHEYCLSNLTRTGAAPVTTYPRQQSCGQPGVHRRLAARNCLPACARTLSNVSSSSETTPLVALTIAGSAKSRAERRAMAVTVGYSAAWW